MVRNYKNNVTATTLNGSVTNVATSWTVDNGSTYPAVPFTALCEDEIVLVTAKSGTNDVNWTVERGYDGTSNVAHNDATEVTDAVVAKDFQFSGAEIRRTSNQSINNTTWTAISWQAEEYDTDGYAEFVTNPTRVTFAEKGKYQVIANPIFANNTNGARFARIIRNGTQTNELALSNIDANASSASDRFQVSCVVNAADDDYIEIEVYHDIGSGTLNLEGATGTDAETTRLWVYRLG